MTQQLITFDYAALDPETRIILQQKTSEIRDRMRLAVQNIVEIGERLIAVRDRLGGGVWGSWLRAEFDWSDQTARRFMHVAQRFGGAQQIVEFAPSALYLLAAPSTPDDARDEALALAEQGTPITHQIAQQIVTNHKPRPDLIVGQRTDPHKPDPKEPPAAEEHDDDQIIRTIRTKAASLGLELIWEDDQVLLYWPDEIDDLDRMEGLSYGAALEWLEWEAPGIAAGRTEQTTAAAPAGAIPHLPPPAEWKAARTRAASLGLRLDMAASGAFCLYRLSDGAAHGGAVDWPATLDLLSRKEADRFRHLCERAEQLGATINPTAYGDPCYVRVIAPKGYQQFAVKCDAQDLARLIAAWETPPNPEPTPTTGPDRAALLRHWRAVETALDRDDQAAAEQAIRAMYMVVHGPCVIVVLPSDAIDPDALGRSIRAIVAGVHADRAEPGLAILRTMLKQSEQGVSA